MSRLKQLIQEIHRRSPWQVLGIYVAVSCAVIEAADVIVARSFPLAAASLASHCPDVLTCG